MSTKLDNRQSITRVGLPTTGAVASDTLDSILIKIDDGLTKLFSDRNVFLAEGGDISFSGVNLTFTASLKLHINQRTDGASPTIIDLGSGAQAFTSDGDMMYVVVTDRNAGTFTGPTVSSVLPALNEANSEVYLIAKRIGNRLYFRNGSALDAGQTAKLGSSGGGGGGGGSGFGSDFGDVYQQLTEEELNAIASSTPNQLIDAFNTDAKGTKVNMEALNDALRFTGSNLTGSYSREKLTSAPCLHITGAVVASLRALAPKGTAIAGNVITFQGDVTPYLQNQKNVLIAKRVISDGETVHQFIINGEGNVARFKILSGPTYSSGPDETTITVENLEALTLDFGLPTSSYNANLRVIPFNYQFSASTADSLPVLEEMQIADAYGRGEIRLPGESFFVALAGITGSVLKQDGAMSPSRQYGMVRILEKTAGDAKYRWFVTQNFGVNWNERSLPAPEFINISSTEELSGAFQYLNSRQIIVADNGKMMSLYTKSEGGKYNTMALRYDPSLLFFSTPTAATGVDASNNSGATAGYIFKDGANDYGSQLDGDRTDLSFVAILSQASNNTSVVRTFTNGGATHNWLSSTSFSTQYANTHMVFVSGSGINHRTTAILKNTSGAITRTLWDEQHAPANAPTFTESQVIANTLDPVLVGGQVGDTSRIVLAYKDTSNSLKYVTGLINNGELNDSTGITPATEYALTNGTTAGTSVDTYNGWNTQSPLNFYKTIGTRVLQNPANPLHFIINADIIDIDTRARSLFFDVRDVSDYRGITVSQYTGTNTQTINQFAGQQLIAQTVQMVGSRLKTFAFKLNRSSSPTPPNTYYVRCKVYPTSVGTPDTSGLPIATSQDIDIAYIGTDKHWTYFTFADTALTPGTVYAFVLEATYSTGSADLVSATYHGFDVYAGGSLWVYDGATWAAGPNYDFAFELNGDWVEFIGQSVGTNVHPTLASTRNTQIWDQESSIAAIDSSNVNHVTRRAIITTPGSNNQMQGYPFKRTISWGSGPAKSTFSDPIIDGYLQTDFENALAFNVSLGDNASAGRDTETGVYDSNKWNNRAGLMLTSNALNASGFSVEPTFLSGNAMDFSSANGDIIIYQDHAAFDMGGVGGAFAFEFEFLPSPPVGTNRILSQHSTGQGHGWKISYLSDESIQIEFINSSGATFGLRKSAPASFPASTTHVVRITWNGSNSGNPSDKIRIYKATSAGGPFNETGYSVLAFPEDPSNNTTNSSAALIVGGKEDIQYPAGVVAHYKFDNSPGILIESVNGYNFSGSNYYSVPSGKFEQGIGINAGAAGPSVGGIGDFNVTGNTTKRCMEAWIQIGSATQFRILARATNASFYVATALYFYIDNSHRLAFGEPQNPDPNTTNTGLAYYNVAPYYDDGLWHYVVGYYDGAGAGGRNYLYFDGVLVGTGTVSGQTAASATGSLALGWEDNPNEWWRGAIDDFVFWKGDYPTPAEIQQRWFNGIGRRYSGETNETFNGKLGYIKASLGSGSFNSTGFVDQSSLVGVQNLGTKTLVESKGGTNSLTNGISFDTVSIVGDANVASVVASNDIVLAFQHTLVNTPGSTLALKIDAGRKSINDDSAIQGINFRFNK